jgi:hypothetical protein
LNDERAAGDIDQLDIEPLFLEVVSVAGDPTCEIGRARRWIDYAKASKTSLFIGTGLSTEMS